MATMREFGAKIWLERVSKWKNVSEFSFQADIPKLHKAGRLAKNQVQIRFVFRWKVRNFLNKKWHCCAQIKDDKLIRLTLCRLNLVLLKNFLTDYLNIDVKIKSSNQAISNVLNCNAMWHMWASRKSDPTKPYLYKVSTSQMKQRHTTSIVWGLWTWPTSQRRNWSLSIREAKRIWHELNENRAFKSHITSL